MAWDFETVRQLVCLVGVVLLTGAAMYTDMRLWKIPNKLTVTGFAAGLLYQGIFNQWAGLSDAGLAFLVGFGTFFLLWIVGGGGAGDVKLVGAISVWIGFRNTLGVMMLSVVFVILGAMAIMLWHTLRHGAGRTRDKYLATGKGAKATKETYEQKRRRSLLAFATPVGLATWVMLALDATILKGGPLGPKPAVAAQAAVTTPVEPTHAL